MVEEIEVGVDGSGPPALVLGVEGLEHIPADQLVVAVQMQTYCVGAAVVRVGVVVVGHGSLLLLVVDVDVSGGRDLVELEVFPVGLIAAVVRAIVGDDRVVVGVVLREDRVQVVLYPESGVVEVARGQDAEGKLLWVVLDLVLGYYFPVVSCQVCSLSLIVSIVDLVVVGDQVQTL